MLLDPTKPYDYLKYKEYLNVKYMDACTKACEQMLQDDVNADFDSKYQHLIETYLLTDKLQIPSYMCPKNATEWEQLLEFVNNVDPCVPIKFKRI